MSLANIKVLDIGAFITGPMACAMLGDLGANVIKVERPKTGDPFRAFSGGLYSPQFCSMNWNKRSITIDLQKSDGVALYKELAADTDVIVENFRPGTAKKLGIDFDSLRAANPRLVYCAISGFGPDGPYRDRPSYDMVAQGASGYLSTLMDVSDDPWVPNPSAGDQLTAIYASYAVLGALLERQSTHVGKLVGVTMLDSMIAFSSPLLATGHRTNETLEKETRAAVSQSFVFPCADSKAVVLHLSSPEHFWTNLLAAMSRPNLGTDPRFDKRGLRIKNYQALKAELAKVFATKPRAEWLALLETHDVPHAPAYTLDEVKHDPQVQHLGTLATYDHPTEGPVLRVRRPFTFDGRRDETIKVPPALGENTADILREIGKTAAEIDRLTQAAVI